MVTKRGGVTAVFIAVAVLFISVEEATADMDCGDTH
jgi:hypothetical protein